MTTVNMGLVKEGHVFEDTEEVDALRDEIRELRAELSQSQREAAKNKREAERATSELRRQLSPLYRALQAVFGELDTIGGTDDVTAQNPRATAAWENWKSKLGKGPAKAIDALLLHGPMTRKQLVVATGYSPANVTNIVAALNKASLITKDGDRVALRTL